LFPPVQQQVIEEVFGLARSIQDESIRAIALIGVAPQLPSELMAEALATVYATQSKSGRADTLIGMIPHLSPPPQQQVIKEVLDFARTIKDDTRRATILIGMAPHLTSELMTEALATVHTIQSTSSSHSANKHDPALVPSTATTGYQGSVRVCPNYPR